MPRVTAQSIPGLYHGEPPAVSAPSSRDRTVTSIPRVMGASGEKAVSPVPENRPRAVTKATLPVYQPSAATSSKTPPAFTMR